MTDTQIKRVIAFSCIYQYRGEQDKILDTKILKELGVSKKDVKELFAEFECVIDTDIFYNTVDAIMNSITIERGENNRIENITSKKYTGD